MNNPPIVYNFYCLFG